MLATPYSIATAADEIGADFAEGRTPLETANLLAVFDYATVLRGIDRAIAQGDLPPGDHDYHRLLAYYHKVVQ